VAKNHQAEYVAVANCKNSKVALEIIGHQLMGPWVPARERRMLWGDLKKKSGGHKRYRGKKAIREGHFWWFFKRVFA